MKLEVIATNLRDIIKINKTDADRIEFCRALKQDGLTPRRWKIKLATRISKIPINVMLRPTSKSFNYSDQEFKRMLKDAAFIERTKANGVVFGILTDKNKIDSKRIKEIIVQIPNKEKVFHKAFDQVPNFQQGLKQLAKLKLDAVLTAAGKDINQNLAQLAELTAMKQVRVIAGGGVNFDNITAISQVVDDVHVGTTIRFNNSWDKKIDPIKIEQLKLIIKKKA